MLKIEGLRVNYGGIQALRGISLEVPDGKIVTDIRRDPYRQLEANARNFPKQACHLCHHNILVAGFAINMQKAGGEKPGVTIWSTMRILQAGWSVGSVMCGPEQ